MISLRTLITTLIVGIFTFGFVLCESFDVHYQLTSTIFVIHCIATAYLGYCIGKDLRK